MARRFTFCCDRMTDAYEKGELTGLNLDDVPVKIMLNGVHMRGKSCPFCGSRYFIMAIDIW